ncbi:MAG: hypothetical protein WCF86_09585, partial [Pseudolabrys sp.]
SYTTVQIAEVWGAFRFGARPPSRVQDLRPLVKKPPTIAMFFQKCDIWLASPKLRWAMRAAINT